MLTLELEVPKDRASLAIATLREGKNILLSDFAAASATPSIGAMQNNRSRDPKLPSNHPPRGVYFLAGHARNSGAPLAEYGADLLLFCPRKLDWLYSTFLEEEEAGWALERHGLLVYGGAPGADGCMRRTQGGVRLSERMISALCKHLAVLPAGQPGIPVVIILHRLKRKPWWACWKRKISTPPLSSETPAIAAPNDESSLLEDLLVRFGRKPRHSKYRSNTRDSQREGSSSSSDSSSSNSSDSFRGQGGQSAGGGASGSWGGAEANSRVAAGMAAGAAAAVVVGAAVAADAMYTTYAAPLADSAGSSDSSWGSGSDSSSSNSGSDSGGGSSDSGGSDSGGGGDGGGSGG